MILDLHLHSERPTTAVRPVESYLKILARKRDERPLDGIVRHRAPEVRLDVDYRPLEDQYGFRILRGAEVESEYGHILVYGVNPDILARFDFTNVRLARRR
jgi:hypothetical protein